MKNKCFLSENYGTWPRQMPEPANNPENLPAITMVTDSYQQAQFLENCLLSVLNQGYPQLEYIVFDGGSTDGSKAILEKYSPQLSYWQSCPDGGQVNAFNTAFEKYGNGEIFGLLDSDDMLAPGALLKIGRYFKEHPDCDWLMGAGLFFDEDGELVQEYRPDTMDPYVLVEEWTNHIVCQPSVFFRKRLWLQFNGYRKDVYQYINDHEILVRAARHGHGSILPDMLSFNLYRKEQVSQKHKYRMFMEEQLLRFEYGNKDDAAQKIKRIGSRAMELDHLFRWITANPWYRKWREHHK